MDTEQTYGIPFVKIKDKNIKSGVKLTKKKEKKKKLITIKRKKKIDANILEKYSDLMKQIQYNKDWSETNNIIPEYWELSNRKTFPGWIDKTFSNYRIKNQTQKYTDDPDHMINRNVQLFTHQKFLKDYLQLESPYRGILLYHGLGSGKTCSSIAIAESLKAKYKVYVMSPKSLQLNYKNELKKCGSVLYQINQYWESFDIDTSSTKELNFLENEYGISKKLLKKNNVIWINKMDEESNFNTLDDVQQTQINEQIMEQIDRDYEFIAYNGLRLNKLTRWIQEKGNPFDNSLVIIDEVHNLVSTIVNNRNIGKLLYKLLLEARNIKIVLLTGTPIINYPHEISIITNILRGVIKQYTVTIKHNPKVWDEEKLNEILSKINSIDQFFIESRNHTIQIVRDPYLFSNRYNIQSKYTGVSKYNNDLEELDWIEMIKLTLEQNNYNIIGKIKESVFKALPDKREDFFKYFIDTESYRIKNEILLKKRISGLISYYSGHSMDLYPESYENIVEVPLSDYQFLKYELARNIEREKESKQSKKTHKHSSKDDIFQLSSYYRVFSRIIGNFVFPEKISRPFGKNIKLEVDIDKVDDQDSDIEEMNMDAIKLKAWKSLVRNKNQYLTIDSLDTYSPKFKQMVLNINDSPGNVFIYSQFKTLEGINTIALCLNTNGYAPFKIGKDQEGNFVEEFDSEEDIDKPKYAIFEGDELMKEYILKVYNNQLDDLPNTLKSTLKARGNNLRGGLLKVLLATSTGAEGIHLENVRQVHITEPYWNPVRIQQVIGRGVRYKSHINLPPEDRNVNIYVYVSVFSQKQISEASFTLKHRDKNPITQMDEFLPNILNPSIYTCFTSDQSIYNIAYKKKKITDDFFRILKESAIDCNLNANQNEDINCFSYSSKVNPTDYSYIPDIKIDEGSAFIQTQQKITEIKGRKIQYKSKYYILSDDNMIYDYECWVGDDGSGSRAVLVGYLNNEGSKEKINFF